MNHSKEEKLSHGELVRQLNYNHLTGILKWKVNKTAGTKIGDIAGTKTKKGYIQIRIRSKSYYAHILAWFHYYEYMPENDIDHKDRIRHHNWISNLREVSKQCNARNVGNYKNNTSEVKGVHWYRYKNKNKWLSSIKINGKSIHLGYYKDFDNAVCARLAAEQCVDWEGCDSCSPAFRYVKENITL